MPIEPAPGFPDRAPGFPPTVARLVGINKKYSNNHVLRSLDLELRTGRFYGLFGRNGSGKSTLMRVLAHRERVDGGGGEVLGKALGEDGAEAASQLGYVSELAFYAGEKLGTLLNLQRAFFPAWDEAYLAKLRAGFGLDLEKLPSQCSRGQLVQFSVLMNLAYRPRLILLDEVTSVLDASARAFLISALRERVAEGATVVLSTNIVTEVDRVASDYVLLENGAVKLNLPAAELAQAFVKLRRRRGEEHPVFSAPAVVEIGIDDDYTINYLLPRIDGTAFPGWENYAAAADPRPAEVFVYLTRFKG